MTIAEHICVLCKRPIGAQTKPEHILLNALGGRMTVANIICPTCNHLMGIGPDNDLAASVAFIRNVCNMAAGDGDAAPTLSGLQTDGQRYDLLPGMDVKMKPHRPLDVKVTDETVEVQIGAYSDAKAEQLADGAARSIAKSLGKVSTEAIEAIKQDILRDRRAQIVPAPMISGQIALGAGRSQQSMAKACLVLWARTVGTSEALTAKYDHLREFLFSNKDKSERQAIKLDTRRLPSLPEKYGTNPNFIWVGSDNEGAAFGYYRLYGAMGWKFILCESGATLNRSACLISNPLQNSVWDYWIDHKSPVPIDWLNEDWNPWPPNFSDVQSALNHLVELAYTQSQDRVTTEWVKEALSSSGLNEGDYLTEEHIRAVVQYLTPRLVATILRKAVPLD